MPANKANATQPITKNVNRYAAPIAISFNVCVFSDVGNMYRALCCIDKGIIAKERIIYNLKR